MIEVIKNKNGTLTDYVIEANDVTLNSSVALNIDTSTDYLYIGADFPFNFFYVKFGVVNATASTMSIETWDGDEWNSVARIKDGTSLAGASFGQSGFVEWTPDRNESWVREDTIDSNDSEQVSGLGDLAIYDQYWIRISFSASLDGTTSASWMGQKYSSDNDLKSEFPELLQLDILDAYESGKTAWLEQHILASNLIEADLKDMNLIDDKVQLIRKEDLRRVSVSKVAELIYTGFGKDNLVDQEQARNEYMRRLKASSFIVDRDADAIIDDKEKVVNTKVVFARR